MMLAELDERNQVTGSQYFGNGYLGGTLSKQAGEDSRSSQSYEKGSISKETGKGFSSGSDVDFISKERELCYYIRDEQGSVRYVVDQSGNVVNEYQYSAFGETERAEERYENRLCYNGQLYDGLTEQYYLRARYYQPKIGRFTQEDFLYEDGLNLYAYCKSNPVMYCDPSGLAKESVKCTTGQAERDCVGDNSNGGSGSKFQEVFNAADNYNLSDDTFNNHILNRHGSDSVFGNKSHFNADFDIKEGINSTLRGDNFTIGPNTGGRKGYIFEQTFFDSIGTNSKGKPLYTLKVVIDEIGG